MSCGQLLQLRSWRRGSDSVGRFLSGSKQFYHQHLDSGILIKIQTGNIKDAVIEEIRFALDTELKECATDG